MPRTIIRLLALLATAALVLGACGGDDDAAGGDGTTTTQAPSDTDDARDDETDSDAGDDDTDGTTTETTEASGSGSGSSGVPNIGDLTRVNDFCELFEMVDDMDDPFLAMEDPNLTPEESSEQARQAFAFMAAYFARASQLAPAEIEADVELFSRFMNEWNDLLAEYDYDFMAMAMGSVDDPELEARFEQLEAEEFDLASNRVEEYVFEECGVDLS